MDKRSDPPVREEELHALLDGQLHPAKRTDLEQRLAQDPEAQATLQAWQHQREALRKRFASVLDEAIPPSLLAAVNRTQQAQHHAQQWWRWGGLAASVLLAFALGWFSHGLMPNMENNHLAGTPSAHEFIQQASFAHAVYTPEVRHPVEVESAQEAHLVQWLSKRLGRPLKAPHLSALGFALVGGRLLPGSDGARALFMYQNERGERVTLYLGNTPTEIRDHTASTEFRYSSNGPVPSFYWVDEGFAYALSGTVEQGQLLKLAQQVHQQL